MSTATEPLTRENRYEGRIALPAAFRPDPSAPAVDMEPFYVTLCRSCGSLVAEGSEDLHERLHPRVSCGQMGCGVVHGDLDDEVFTPAGHAWEEQFR